MLGASSSKYIAILVGLLSIGLVLAKRQPSVTNLIDDERYGIGYIARIVCDVKEGTEWQIAETTTIVKLGTYFENMVPDNDLNECRERYNKAFQQLKSLVSTSDDDVCSGEKIDKVVEFHRQFISRSFQDKLLGDEIPKILEQFFIHYVYQISLECKEGVINQLDTAEAKENELKLTDKTEELKELDKIIREFSSVSGGTSGSLKNFYDILIIWTLVEKSPLVSEPGIFNEPTSLNNYKRINVVTRETGKIKRVQRECQSLKSLYESPLLATVRLIDLGYYINDEDFANELQSRPNLRRLIGLVIVCETLLPVRLIQDDSLKPGQTILLTSKKADEYQATNNKEGAEEENDESKPSFEFNKKQRHHSVQSSLHFVTPYTAGPILDKVTENIRDRERVIKRVLKGILGRITWKITSFFTQFFSLNLTKKDLFPADLLPLFEMLA